MRPVWLLLTLFAVPAEAGECMDRLDELGVAYRPAAAHLGIEEPVEVDGPLGGVSYVHAGRPAALVLDCSLVYSLALAGRYFVDEGLSVAYYTDAYDRRYVHGTTRWSKHSFGLALDVHWWQDPTGTRRVSVADDYEKGLGRGRDCLGRPDEPNARSLRILWCRLTRSELFRMVLDPDFDYGHRDHFHMQAPAWEERNDLGWRR